MLFRPNPSSGVPIYLQLMEQVKHGIETGAGLIDQGYRHQVGVLLYNFSDSDFAVNPGDRIAQICIERYESPVFIEVPQDSRGINVAADWPLRYFVRDDPYVSPTPATFARTSYTP